MRQRRPGRLPLSGLAVLLAATALLLVPLPLPPARIVNVVDIARPAADIYDYVTTAGNWPRWHPSSLAVSGATGHPLLLGEQVSEQFIVAGYRGTVLWTVVLRDAPQRWVIRGQIAGGGHGSISYRLHAYDGGTRLEREFEYARPNVLFLLADALRLRARVRGESELALQRLRRELERAPVT